MVLALASTLGMSREEWLETRRKGIGGSDVAAIAGLSKWKSPMKVYLEKLGELPDEEESESAFWGKVHEPAIAEVFSERTGYKVQRRNAILYHREFPWMLANVDRLIFDPNKGWGVLEIKTTNEYCKEDWQGDKAPEAYILQLQHYLAVTGYSYGYLAVLIGGNKYQHALVERNDSIITSLIDIERDFWQKVESRTPPEWTGLECDQELLAQRFPDSIPEPVELPPTVESLIDDYFTACIEKKQAESKAEEASAKLKALLGEHEVGWYGDRKVSWKAFTSSRLDSTRLKAERPEIYEAYAKESVSRRFAIK